MWISNHSYFIEKWIDLNTELYRLHQTGVEIHYFEGNHDLYLSTYFHEQLGFNVHASPLITQLGPHKLRIEHGDQMDPSDWGYRFLRAALRSRLFTWLAPRLPGPRVAAFGERMSEASRQRRDHTVSTDSTLSMQRLMSTHYDRIKAGENFFIAGHIHHRFSLSHKNSDSVTQIINLGTWGPNAHLLEITESGARFLDL